MRSLSTILMIGMLAGCGSDDDTAGADAPATADGAGVDGTVTADAGGDAAAVADSSGLACSIIGNYRMTRLVCDTTDITTAFQMAVPDSTAIVSQRAGGGCIARITNASPGVCSETENMEAIDTGPFWNLSYLGIDTCNPAGCMFVATDAPCVIGDRVGTATATIAPGGASFVLTLTTTTGICANSGLFPEIQTWTLR